MRTSRLALVLVVFVSLFVAFPSFSQQSVISPQQNQHAPVGPPVIGQDAQSLALMNASLAAFGGGPLANSPRAQIAVLISGTYTDTQSPEPITFPIRIKILGLDQIRWEIDKPDGTYVTLIIGGAGWRWGPKTFSTLPVSALAGVKLEALPLLALADWIGSTSEVSLKYAGAETLNGRPTDHVAISRAPVWLTDATSQALFQKQNPEDLYLDSATHLPAELHFNEHPRDARVNSPVRLVFSNYTRTGAFSMPMTVERWVMGVKLGEYDFSSVSFGASINPADFGVN